jgi:hypothetical protein
MYEIMAKVCDEKGMALESAEDLRRAQPEYYRALLADAASSGR